MDFMEFLNVLENTLEKIEVRGRANINRMMGCFQAIDRQRAYVAQGGEVDGRQTDIGVDPSNDSNDAR